MQQEGGDDIAFVATYTSYKNSTIHPHKYESFLVVMKSLLVLVVGSKEEEMVCSSPTCLCQLFLYQNKKRRVNT
jgi:hypothetical protein